MNLKTTNEWYIVEDSLKNDAQKEHETIFSLSNGYLGIRGFHYEFIGFANDDAIYLNGFYDTESYIYGESGYGYARNKQKMIPLPQLCHMQIQIDNHEITSTSNIYNYQRTLDMKRGVVSKAYDVVLGENTLNVLSETMVSHDQKHLIAMTYRIRSSLPCQLNLTSVMHKSMSNDGIETDDPRVGSLRKKKYIHLIEQECIDDQVFYHYKTDGSNLELNAAVSHEINSHYTYEQSTSDALDKINFIIELQANEELTFTKYAAFSDEGVLFSEFVENYHNSTRDYQQLVNAQNETFKSFWDVVNIELEADVELVSALRFNLFSLFQHVGKDGKKNICAKGLSGEGYEGHYFWDTEIYVLPFFIYNLPNIARNLLISRYKMLDKARERANTLSYDGCLFAWRTINGEEASAYYPAGTAQIHINADIAYSITTYYNATQDIEFMEKMGFEMLKEIADFFVSYADYVEGKGFVINGVTGPDEYSALVNNNIYTNLMIKQLLDNIIKLSSTFKLERYGISNERLGVYQDLEQGIYIAQENGIYSQDDSFFSKSPWDFKKRNQRPLLLHYHPMVIYKHQVLKQADIVLSLLTCFKYFSYEDALKIYDYYEPLTTHDSTLSETVHGIIASKINRGNEAYTYFANTVKTDLYNQHHNVDAGLHMAAMAGGWQSLYYGFAGIRIDGDTVYLSPNLPEPIKKLKMQFLFRGVTIELVITAKDVVYTCSQTPESKGFKIKKIELGEDYD